MVVFLLVLGLLLDVNFRSLCKVHSRAGVLSIIHGLLRFMFTI